MGKEGFRPTIRDRAKTALQNIGDSLRAPQSAPHPKDLLKLIAGQPIPNHFDSHSSRMDISTKRSSTAKIFGQNKAP